MTNREQEANEVLQSIAKDIKEKLETKVNNLEELTKILK